MLRVNAVLTEQEYKDLRWQVIKRLEGVKSYAYIAGEGVAVIGVGFNIEGNVDLRDAIYRALVMAGPADTEYRRRIDEVITTSTTTAGLQAAIQTIMDERIADNNALPEDERRTGLASEFKLSDVEDEQRALFESAVESYETILDKWLGAESLPYSSERVALLSLAYHSVIHANGRGAPNMQAAVRSDDRIRAWFEIRYVSNGGADFERNGIAKRRYIEAELFDLFPAISSDLQLEVYAAKIIEFFNQDAYPGVGATTNLAHMIAYEQLRGHMIDDAQAEIAAMTGVNLHIQSWGKIFKPIAGYLVDHYLLNENLDIYGANYSFDGEVVLGLATAGVIQSTNTAATGKDKGDLLIAIDDSASNILEGGKGNDFLIGANGQDILRGGDDHDVLIGKGGHDYLDGGAGIDYLVGGTGNDKLIGGAGNDWLEGGEGNDTYIFDGAFGFDEISDEDGNGNVVINGVTVGEVKLIEGTDIIYRSTDGNIDVLRINEGNSTTLMLSQRSGAVGAGGVVLVRDWSEGDLGITLDNEAETPTPPAQVLIGDNNNNVVGYTGTLQGLQPVARMEGGAGDDLIRGLMGDTLLGGDGDDWILGRYQAGRDLLTTHIDGGDHNDTIHGGEGDDRVYEKRSAANDVIYLTAA